MGCHFLLQLKCYLPRISAFYRNLRFFFFLRWGNVVKYKVYRCCLSVILASPQGDNQSNKLPKQTLPHLDLPKGSHPSKLSDTRGTRSHPSTLDPQRAATPVSFQTQGHHVTALCPPALFRAQGCLSLAEGCTSNVSSPRDSSSPTPSCFWNLREA